MNDFDVHYNNLENYVGKLREKFLEPSLGNPTAHPEEYDEFVKAFCVLSHAAIEEYFEEVALKVMKRAIDDWQAPRRVYRDTLVTLLTYFKLELAVDDNERNRETKVFDYLRPLFEEAKKRFSNYVHHNNGASIVYLRKLMIPVGLDILDDATLLNSLKQLSGVRGDYAHRQNHTKKILAPEDAKNYVTDCLKICTDIRDKANNKFKKARGRMVKN